MSIMRWILVLALIVAFVMFAIPNWTPVSLVFGRTIVTTPLPLVVLGSYLLAFVPMALLHRWSRSRWTARLSRTGAPAAPFADADQPTTSPYAYGLHEPAPCAPSLGQPIVPPAGA